MNHFYLKILICFLAAGALLGSAFTASAASVPLKQGEVLIYPLNIETETSAYLGKEKMPVFEHDGKKYALLAADVNEKAGNYNLKIKSGTQKEEEKKIIKVKLGNFKKILTKVPYKFSTLSKDLQEKVVEEKAPLAASLIEALTKPAQKLWTDFQYPLDKITITSPFGYKRIYTNHTTTHTGVDLRAAIGTPVYAISDGEILWGEQKRLYLEGPTVVIDHGEGIVSKYLHLSKVIVKTGDTVKGGDIIGYSGAEGADVTGAHLHFAIKVGDASVNPLQFINEFQKLK
jgi:murein DD-endopeptidase MepM/ murein hydrolase activator NlpD